MKGAWERHIATSWPTCIHALFVFAHTLLLIAATGLGSGHAGAFAHDGSQCIGCHAHTRPARQQGAWCLGIVCFMVLLMGMRDRRSQAGCRLYIAYAHVSTGARTEPCRHWCRCFSAPCGLHACRAATCAACWRDVTIEAAWPAAQRWQPQPRPRCAARACTVPSCLRGGYQFAAGVQGW